MKRRVVSALSAAVLGASSLALAAPAQAHDRSHHGHHGHRSLATVLAADGSGFDRRWQDFDILDNAVRAVLAAKPDSPVGVLADGRVRLTAFAPTDLAFRRLVRDLTGVAYDRERRVFKKLAATAGIDTIEAVLLYHVVPGSTITYYQAKKADGAKLPTALDGATIRVKVWGHSRIMLRDQDRDDRNARVIRRLANINKGNKQIAHGISQVLRPIDL